MTLCRTACSQFIKWGNFFFKKNYQLGSILNYYSFWEEVITIMTSELKVVTSVMIFFFLNEVINFFMTSIFLKKKFMTSKL